MEEKAKTNKFKKFKQSLTSLLTREGIVKKTILWSLAVLLLFLLISVIVNSFKSGHKYSDSSIPESTLTLGEYNEYLQQYPAVYPKNVDIVIPGKDAFDTDFVVVDYILEYGELALKTTANGSATWEFVVEETGFYNILLDYIPELDNGSDIERRIYINGKVPYGDLNNITFQRVWTDGGKKIVDLNGNEIRPVQVEMPIRRQSYVKDKIGYVTEPYLVYLSKGKNTITIESIRESMSIFNIHIMSKEEYRSYEEVKAEYEVKGYKKVKGGITGYYVEGNPRIEGEDSVYRSSSTLYAIHDRSSAYNSPSDPVKIILNSIGGTKWATPGDWITWEFTVPESGLYNISLRARQSANRGLFSTRKVYIDDKIPFAEAQNAKFTYASNWNIVTLGTETEPFYFYLEEGTHTITLEVTLGDYGSHINRIQEVINELNRMYRAIIAKIGVSPDKYIDYRLTESIPDLIPTFEKCIVEIEDVAATITRISGEKSGESASLETMALQLRDFIKNPRKIQRNLRSFSTNISSLGTWVLTVSEQTLVVDYLLVHSDDYKLPKANPNFFGGLWFDIKSFVQSFFFDYSSIGATVESQDEETVEVWFLTDPSAGREQGNSIRTLIDSTFEGSANIELKIVSPEVLLMATLANRGPDVAINVGNGIPVNYALRGAVKDLTMFSDFDEVVKRFYPSAIVPYLYRDHTGHEGYYALPNTQLFPVIFYRTDIFEDYGWKVPNTWDEVIDLIPELQIHNMKFYLPLNTSGAASVVNGIFASRLFQTGGSFYRTELNDAGEEYVISNFDSEESMRAFEFWTEFYTSYSFELTITWATFINRFRTGEMPIGISDYNVYNTLMVSAPEIRGKWTFAKMPGTIQEDGSIVRSTATSGSAVIMLENTKVPYAAWEFMKWWTSAEIQTAYNRELEAIIGPAARHATPNIEAFANLPWTVEELEILNEQFSWTVGVPEVPGGYYTGRNLENAFRRVVNNNINPRQTFEEYIVLINREITRKRKEFGLPVPTGE